MKNKTLNKKYKQLIILFIILLLLIGMFYFIKYQKNKIDNRLNNACIYCGYDNYTDYTYVNNYNSFTNPITLILVECNNRYIIDLYDGIYSTDKWGNKIIKIEDTVFCNQYS